MVVNAALKPLTVGVGSFLAIHQYTNFPDGGGDAVILEKKCKMRDYGLSRGGKEDTLSAVYCPGQESMDARMVCVEIWWKFVEKSLIIT